MTLPQALLRLAAERNYESARDAADAVRAEIRAVLDRTAPPLPEPRPPTRLGDEFPTVADEWESVLGKQLKPGDVVKTTSGVDTVFRSQRGGLVWTKDSLWGVNPEYTYQRQVRPKPAAGMFEAGLAKSLAELDVMAAKIENGESIVSDELRAEAERIGTPDRFESVLGSELREGDVVRTERGDLRRVVTNVSGVVLDVLSEQTGGRLPLVRSATYSRLVRPAPVEAEPVESPAPPPLVVQVGRRYRRRDGAVVECVKSNPEASRAFRFTCTGHPTGVCYCPDGRYLPDREEPCDLVEDLGPVASECPVAAPDWLTDEMVELLRSGRMTVQVWVDGVGRGDFTDALESRLAPHLDDERKALLAEAGR